MTGMDGRPLQTIENPAPPCRNPRTGTFADLGPRVLSSLVLVAVALACILAGGLPFAIVFTLAALVMLVEWHRMILGTAQSASCTLGLAALLAAAVLAVAQKGPWALALLAAAACLGALLAPRRRALSGLGILYAGGLLLSVIVLRNTPRFGLGAILWLCAVAWGHDIAAYFGGRLIGGPKLWPRVSPSKTWAGGVAGVAVGGLAGAAVAAAAGPIAPPATFLPALGLAVVGSIAVQAGDLFESGLKRMAGVKDSGRLIPGHGGVMDRLDGFLVVAVLAAMLGVGRGGWHNAANGLFNW